MNSNIINYNMNNNMNSMNNNMNSLNTNMNSMHNNMNSMNYNMNNNMNDNMNNMNNNMNSMNNMNNMNMGMMNMGMKNLNMNTMPTYAQKCPPPSLNSNNSQNYLSGDQIEEPKSDNKKVNNNIKKENNEHADMNLILSQDIIEGFWNENNETKGLINIITLEKFDKIKNKINAH